MRGIGNGRRRPVRGITWLAAIAAVLAASGVAVGARAAIGAAAGPQTVRDSLAYTCTFPSGQERVSVLVEATFPAAGVAGRQIQPSGAQVTVALPHPAVASLTALHAATVSATTSLTIEVTQAGRSAAAAWPGLTAAGIPVPAKGTLALTAPGTAGPVTVASPGDVTFNAAGLSLDLRPHQANGTATRPPVMRVPCTLSPSQNATLAAVPVPGATGTTASRRPGTPQKGSLVRPEYIHYCPALPKGGLKKNPRFPWPPIPRHSHVTYTINPPYCAYVAGFSDVLKLHGASLIGPGLTDLTPFLRQVYNFSPSVNYFQQDSVGELWYHGLHEFPPAKATFLSFGFMPTTATMQLSEIGTINDDLVGPATACTGHSCKPDISTVSSRLMLRIYNVKVNGAPLNVGPRCQTPPFNVVVTGSSFSKPPYMGLTTGGPLTGAITIPPFTGCGVGENLDSLFSASVSGPGNFSILTQAPVCEPGPNPYQCPPATPTPVRQVSG